MEKTKGGYLSLFQFHKGTIKTIIAKLGWWGIPCFNSIKVRLRQQQLFVQKAIDEVSIP